MADKLGFLDNDGNEVSSRPQSSVFRRMLCLRSVLERFAHEPGDHQRHLEEARSWETWSLASAREWWTSDGCLFGFAPSELFLLRKPLKKLNEADCLNASWQAESLAVMTWALGFTTALPAYDTLVDSVALMRLVPLFDSEQVQALAARAQLRPADELESGYMEARRWHQRAQRVEYCYRDSDGSAAGSSHRAEMVQKALEEENVALFQKSYAQLTIVEFLRARSIAHERHRALRWIVDGGDWDHENYIRLGGPASKRK